MANSKKPHRLATKSAKSAAKTHKKTAKQSKKPTVIRPLSEATDTHIAVTVHTLPSEVSPELTTTEQSEPIGPLPSAPPVEPVLADSPATDVPIEPAVALPAVDTSEPTESAAPGGEDTTELDAPGVAQPTTDTPDVEEAEPDPRPAAKQPQAGLSIQINFPAFKRPALTRTRKHWAKLQPYWNRIRPQLTKRRLIAAGLAVLALVVILSAVHAINVRHRNQTAARAISAGRQQEAKPTFKPIVPSSRSNLAVPDGTNSRFDASHGTYSFIDSVASKQFTVSEQQFASNVAAQSALGRAAQSLAATHQVITKWGTAYLITIPKYGSQEIVFSSNNLLCFIQSANVLTDDQWISYINTLG